MSSMLSACVTFLLLIVCVGLDVCILYDSGVPVSKTIPCSDNECDFSVLKEINVPDDQITWMEYIWNSQFQNMDINVTEIYYCSNGMEGAVDFYPCNIYHIYFTLFLINMLPVLTVLLLICCCSSSSTKASHYDLESGNLVRSQPLTY